MVLPKITTAEVNAFFEFVVPRQNGVKTPENYFPTREEGTNYAALGPVAQATTLRIAAVEGKHDVASSLLLTGFLMGREFAAWKQEMDEMSGFERMMLEEPPGEG